MSCTNFQLVGLESHSFNLVTGRGYKGCETKLRTCLVEPDFLFKPELETAKQSILFSRVIQRLTCMWPTSCPKLEFPNQERCLGAWTSKREEKIKQKAADTFLLLLSLSIVFTSSDKRKSAGFNCKQTHLLKGQEYRRRNRDPTSVFFF